MRNKKRIDRIKNFVIVRDGQQCCYCDKALSYEEVTMEHIVPQSFRGTYNTTNLTVSCAACNNARGNKSFFEYYQKHCKTNNLVKYKNLYKLNLRIKVLNIAKENCLNGLKQAVPNELIKNACKILRTSTVINFSSYVKKYNVDIDFEKPTKKEIIKYWFETLIKLIENESI